MELYSNIRDLLTNSALTNYSDICSRIEAFRLVLVEVSFFEKQEKYRRTQWHSTNYMKMVTCKWEHDNKPEKVVWYMDRLCWRALKNTHYKLAQKKGFEVTLSMKETNSGIKQCKIIEIFKKMITEENVNWNADNSVSKQEIGDVHPKGREEEKGQEYQKKIKKIWSWVMVVVSVTGDPSSLTVKHTQGTEGCEVCQEHRYTMWT